MPFIIRQYQAPDEAGVIALWNDCGLVVPWNDPHKDIQRKLSASPEGFLVVESEGEIVGSLMVGFDGHRAWVNYLAVAPEKRRQGLGQKLMARAEAMMLERGCPKLSLQVRETNVAVIAFYEKLGYKQDAVVSLGKRLIADN